MPGARALAARSLTIAALLAAAATGCARDDGWRGIVPAPPTPIPALALPELHERGPATEFTLRPPAGRLLIVYFGYATCPDVCPTTLAELRAALEAVGRPAARVEVAFVTVDMARDTTQVLVPYLRSLLPGAHPLRPASQEQLATAERAFGASSMVTRDLAGKVTVSHTALCYAVDGRGMVRVEWSFGTPREDLAHDLRRLLAETAKEEGR